MESEAIKAAVGITRVTSRQFWSGKPPPGPGSRCNSSPSSYLAPGRKEDSWLHLKSKWDTHQLSTEYSISLLSYTSSHPPQDAQHGRQSHILEQWHHLHREARAFTLYTSSSFVWFGFLTNQKIAMFCCWAAGSYTLKPSILEEGSLRLWKF